MDGMCTTIIDASSLIPDARQGELEETCLVFIHPSGPLMGRRISLRAGQYLIGRDPSSDLHLDSIAVSRKHAVLRRNGHGWKIEDQRSTNGVLINGIRRSKECYLRDRDVITLGDISFKFLHGNNLELAYHDEIYRLTITDALTQVHNRRYFFECLGRELALARRFRTPVSVVMMDLDYFKRVNDTYGHAVGDQLLRAIADRIRARVRSGDLVARYGGEEFAAMLPRTDRTGGIQFAKDVNELVGGRAFELDDVRIKATVSLGVATFDGYGDGEAIDLVREADDRLLQAKRDGRDRVIG